MRKIFFLFFVVFGIFLHVHSQTVEDISTVHYLNGIKPPTYDIQKPTPAFYLSRGMYRINHEHDFKNGLNDLINGLREYTHSLYYRYTSITNSILLLMWISIIALYASVILFSLRFHKSVLFKKFHTFYESERSFLVKILMSLGVFIFFISGGWIFFFICIQGILKKKEIILILVLTTLSALPLTIVSLFPQFYAYIHKPALITQLHMYDNFQIDYIVRDELKELTAELPESYLLKYLLAKYYKGASSLYKDPNGYPMALSYYNEMALSEYFPEVAYTNIGNIYFVQGDIKNAFTAYEKAIKISPENPYALYNMSQWYLFRGDDDLFNNFYKKALITAHSQNITLPDNSQTSITLFDAEISRSHVWKHHTYAMFAMSGIDVLFSTTTMIILTTFPLMLLLVGLLFARFNSNFRAYTHCFSCDVPLYPSSARTTYMNNTLCPDCSVMVSQNSYSADINANRKRSLFFACVKASILQIILPGSGFLYNGHLAKGIIFMMLSIGLALPHFGSQFIFFPSIIDDMVLQSLLPLFFWLQGITILWSILIYIHLIRRKNG